MSWTYRVMESTHEDGTPRFGIHEVYDGPGWTAEPEVWAESVEGLKWMLEAMLKATEKPVFADPDNHKLRDCERGTPRGLGCWMCENAELNRVRAERDAAIARAIETEKRVEVLREALGRTQKAIIVNAEDTLWVPDTNMTVCELIDEALAATAPSDTETAYEHRRKCGPFCRHTVYCPECVNIHGICDAHRNNLETGVTWVAPENGEKP